MAFFKKKPAGIFELDAPKLSVTPNFPDLEAQLKAAKVDYKVVAEGYIVFAGRAFQSDLPLMIGIHFHSAQIERVELFRPREYYRSGDHSADASFAELSEVLKKRYGEPTAAAAEPGYGRREEWTMPERGYRIDHSLFDRFGPEEHLNIYFRS